MLIPGVECLKLFLKSIADMKITVFDNLIDGLFWSFRPKSVTVESCNKFHDKFLKVCVCFKENLISTICKYHCRVTKGSLNNLKNAGTS